MTFPCVNSHDPADVTATRKADMVRTRRERFPAFAAAFFVLTAALAACSSNPPPKPAPDSSQAIYSRLNTAYPLIAQCAISAGIPAVTSSATAASVGLSKSQQWLYSGQLVLTKVNYGFFNGWYEGHAGLVVAGQMLDSWAQDAAKQDKLPAALCGPGVSARRLYVRMFAHFPAELKDDPWDS
jgi:hypothetical protein